MADALEATGSAAAPTAARTISDAEANRLYAEATGVDWTDPAARERVYAAVAEMRRQQLDRQGKLDAQRAKALGRVRGRKARTPPQPKAPGA